MTAPLPDAPVAGVALLLDPGMMPPTMPLRGPPSAPNAPEGPRAKFEGKPELFWEDADRMACMPNC